MEHNTLKLTVSEIELVVNLFVRGFPRSDVISELCVRFPNRFPAETLDKDKLSNHLRKYDPSSKGFSVKYERIFAIHQQRLFDVLGDDYERLWVSVREDVFAQVEALRLRIGQIETHIDLLYREQMIWLKKKIESKTFEALVDGKVVVSDHQLQRAHQQVIDIDKQLQQWYKIRRQEEDRLFQMFFALRKLENEHLRETARICEAEIQYDEAPLFSNFDTPIDTLKGA